MKPEPPPPPPPKKEKKKPKPVAKPVKKKNKKKDKKKDPKFESTGKIMARKVLKKKGDSQTPPVRDLNCCLQFIKDQRTNFDINVIGFSKILQIIWIISGTIQEIQANSSSTSD